MGMHCALESVFDIKIHVGKKKKRLTGVQAYKTQVEK